MKKNSDLSFLESVNSSFDLAANALELPKGLAHQIRTCNAVCEMKFGVDLDDGYEIFTGWRATHSEHALELRAGFAMHLLRTSMKWRPLLHS